VSESESDPQNQRHINTNNSQFSLSDQLDQNPNKLRKPDEYEEQIPQIITVSEAISSKSNGVFHTALRDSTESSSLSWNFCNSSIESIAKSHESNAITETLKSWKEEEENEELKDSEPVTKKKKELPAHSRIRTKNQENRIRNSEFLKVLAQTSDWNSGKHGNFVLIRSKTTVNLRTM